MPLLTDVGSVSYNNFVFPLYSKTHVTATPIYDLAKRAVERISYSVEVEFYVTADPSSSSPTSIDAQMAAIRKQITTRGGKLVIDQKGFGPLTVNDPNGTVRDVAMGPHPEMIDCTPVGSRAAWLLRWRCTTSIPECSEGTAVTTGRIMSFNYTWAIHQDEHGFSTRTVSGQFVIPMTLLAGARTPPDSGDVYWERVLASIPPLTSCKRTVDRNLSEDRRTVKFTVTDMELSKDAFVRGITEWQGSHEISTDLMGGKFAMYVNTLSATYKVSRDQPKRLAWERFLALVQSRYRSATPNLATQTPIPLAMQVREDITSQEVSFMFKWRFGCLDPSKALAAGGLFLGVPDAGWAQWATSMARTALAARGNMGLMYNPRADALVDLCQDGNGNLNNLRGFVDGAQERTLQGFRPTLPPRERSFLLYQCSIVYESDEGIHVLRTIPPNFTTQQLTALNIPIQTSGQSTLLANQAQGFGAPIDLNATPIRLPSTPPTQASVTAILSQTIPNPEGTALPNRVQKRANKDARIRVIGKAVRAGYPINPPILLGAGGKPAILEKPHFAQGVVANSGGIPLIAAVWNYKYVLPGTETEDLPFVPNPVLGY